MAEEKKDFKKDDKKEEKKSSSIISWEEVILLLLGILALIFVFLPKFFSPTGSYDVKGLYDKVFSEQNQVVYSNNGQPVQVIKQPSLIEEGKSRFVDLFNYGTIIVFSFLIFIILLFLIIIYYNKFRRELITKEYKKKFETEDRIKIEDKIQGNNEKILESSNTEPDTNDLINPRWQIIGKYYNSANQSDWKLAIIEADIMLYEVLSKSGFPGISIGEMLKNADKSKLNSLDEAWSAHKVRNEIAHSGLDYVLSRDVVEKVIGQYEKVFDEMGFI